MSGRMGPPGSDFAHLQQDNAEIERSMLAQEVEALRSRLGLRQVDVSKECGVNASMLSQWMLGRYKGNIARINGLMEGWLVNRRGGKPLDKSAMLMQAPHRMMHHPSIGDGGGMDAFHQHSKRKPLVQLAERPLYKYPKITHNASALVPIRLDVDVDGYRYIDSFAYNIHESDFTYDTFSASLIRDLDLPDCFYAPIATAIRLQVEAATSHVHKPSSTTKKDTALIPIYIKLRINDTVLIDSFEWDVSNDLNNPDAFAAALCADLGLDDGEFQVQIALSIRDQLLAYAKKSDGQQQQARLAPVTSHPLRDFDEAKLWEPKVRYVVADDIALLEREDFKRMRPTSSMPAPLQTSVMPYFPVRSAAMFPSQYAAYPQGSGKPNRPPKPVNTFLIFCRQWRKKLMAQNPNASAKEASRLLGEMWQKLTEEQRAR
ncbi:hypothetical protein, variant [Aphanomyces astaci]|uniref:HMG box domain-containing protein n=1 Tax=Aphanomyces astaci TaxID=112090 RepID=W4FP37_APHAT|nr:hypothetical protein, variant [Aphanomyces astaci]ETV69262.1 hypothetical protein, variant [Aphanomyces astaci]|eukprot:XP_009841119.1 hypothetical protein, variant [Aphanomyces astaci]